MRQGAVFALLFAFSLPTQAGKVYRCPDGSYQDKPCGQGERVVASNNPKAAPPPDADPQCHERGRAAGRLAALRDKGVSADKLLADIDASGKSYDQRIDDKAFTVKVLQTKGTPVEVGALVEAECVKDKRAEAARAAQATQTPAPAAATDTPAPRVGPKEADEVARLCGQLRTDAKRNKAQARKGGSIAEMETLSDEGRDIAAQLKEMCPS